MNRNPLHLSNTLGDYLREQRVSAKLSLRQMSELAGVSNPYLSQIERGLKKPSADILQQIAKALHVSAESLYVRAGLLDPDDEPPARPTVPDVIRRDTALTGRQKSALIDIYESFVGPAEPGSEQSSASETADAGDTTSTVKDDRGGP